MSARSADDPGRSPSPPAVVSGKLIKALSGARRVAFFTGAGISAESGVPTFRGDEGIWKKFKPEELATFSAFRKNPELVWEWYRMRKEVMTTVQPNAGHRAIVDLERHYRVTVITQNVDNLHRRAGSSVVHELHGNIERNYCTGCGKFYTDAELRLAEVAVPTCPKCAGAVRPDVVWFGESLPGQEWKAVGGRGALVRSLLLRRDVGRRLPGGVAPVGREAGRGDGRGGQRRADRPEPLRGRKSLRARRRDPPPDRPGGGIAGARENGAELRC